MQGALYGMGSTLRVGADVIKVLAGPELANLTYRPPSQDELGPNPLLVAEERGTHESSPGNFLSTQSDGSEPPPKAEPPPKDEAVRAHEYRAAIMLRQGQPVATLAELEAALCLAEQRSLVPPAEIRRRWQTLTASAVSWSLDCLAAASDKPGIYDQALQMLCTAEILTRTEVAETFGAKGMPSRTFLRALSLAGLGAYYQQRGKPRAAVRFLEQAVGGQAKFAHPAVLLNLCSSHLQLREPGRALSYLCQAVLALRSATGRLCSQDGVEVDASATAATAAVLAVLGPAKPEDLSNEVDVWARGNLWVDPFGQGIDLWSEDQRPRRAASLSARARRSAELLAPLRTASREEG
ncbi:CPK2 [Symbiodinium natans]|uniref:CPK2 protein n=1 Tax=Symbiodinium natans TaxID=878477 RepID=A0A812HUW1_9DINO|nr:CPK2 [Symbiodinium natans]